MKMTKIRKNQLQIKLQESRSRLMESYPFFAILLMYLRFVAVDDIRNISTNGRCIFFNANFIAKLYPNELDFILCHQVMHIVNGDIWRGRALAGDDYHRACDICINAQLIAMGWKISSFSHLGKLQHTIPMYYGRAEVLSPQEIYERLPYKLSWLDEKTRMRYMTDSDTYWDYKDCDYLDGIVILDVPKMTKYVDGLEQPEEGQEGAAEEPGATGEGAGGGKGKRSEKQQERKPKKARRNESENAQEREPENVQEQEKEPENVKGIRAGMKAGTGMISGQWEALEDFWAEHIDHAAALALGMGKKAGKIPGGMKRHIQQSKKRVVDWKKILDDFVQEEITDYSFTPPDRRYADADFFLPDYNEKDYAPKDILFMADTSGSVRREDLSRVYAEIESAIELFGGKLNGKLGFFDCEVTDPIPFQGVEDILSIIPYGGGGTSFEIIFEYVREHLNEFTPAMIVIFTDGRARFPEPEAAMNIPVLWLISNCEVTPPWGKVGRVV